jgi:hypothetical protein
MPTYYTATKIREFVNRVVSSDLNVDEQGRAARHAQIGLGHHHGRQHRGNGREVEEGEYDADQQGAAGHDGVPDVLHDVKRSVNPATGHADGRRCWVTFQDEADARLFVDKVSRYCHVVRQTGGVDLRGCGIMDDTGFSAATADVKAAARSVKAFLASDPAHSRRDNVFVREILDVLHSFRDVDGRESGIFDAAAQGAPHPRIGVSLLDLHREAEARRAAVGRDSNATTAQASATRTTGVVTRALHSVTAQVAVDSALDRLTLDEAALFPDLLWDLRRLHSRAVHATAKTHPDAHEGDSDRTLTGLASALPTVAESIGQYRARQEQLADDFDEVEADLNSLEDAGSGEELATEEVVPSPFRGRV